MLCKGVLQVLHPEIAVIFRVNLRHVEPGGGVGLTGAQIQSRRVPEAGLPLTVSPAASLESMSLMS